MLGRPLIFSHYCAVIYYQFEQFSRTLGDAAEEQQLKIRSSFYTMSTAIRSQAEATKQVWPKVDIINFQELAVNALATSGVETSMMGNYVTNETVADYLEWVAETHLESAKRNYLQYFGTLEGLNTTPSIYRGYIRGIGGDPFVNHSFAAAHWNNQPPMLRVSK